MTKQELDTERDRLAHKHCDHDINRDKASFRAGFDDAVKIMEERRVKPLREALELYSDAMSWGSGHAGPGPANDEGVSARQAIDQVPEME